MVCDNCLYVSKVSLLSTLIGLATTLPFWRYTFFFLRAKLNYTISQADGFWKWLNFLLRVPTGPYKKSTDWGTRVHRCFEYHIYRQNGFGFQTLTQWWVLRYWFHLQFQFPAGIPFDGLSTSQLANLSVVGKCLKSNTLWINKSKAILAHSPCFVK